MDNRELILKLHQYFNGDTHFKSERYWDGEAVTPRWRYRTVSEKYSDEERLDANTYVIDHCADGDSSIRALTFKEILEAIEEIKGKD